MEPNTETLQDLRRIVAVALAEDIGAGDITSRLTLPEVLRAMIRFVAQEEMVMCGGFVAQEVYRQLDERVNVRVPAKEGQRVRRGDVLAEASGHAQALLSGERAALNIMQHMAGVATLTRRYADALKDSKTVLLDTRKTMPGLRLLDKYAVRTGGGQNHRMRLDDMILIKDNHIAACGGIAQAVAKARAGSKLPIEVECDRLDQVKEALAAKPDRIMLDNMGLEDIRAAVKLAAGKAPLEVSGGITLENIAGIARTGVDFVSVGRLTHSAPAADIGAEIITD